MHLFQDRLALKVFARNYARPPGSVFKAMALLHTLQQRRREGFLDVISETRIEQSFNERLFAELFGYRTLLRNGAGHYHLQPKNYHGGRRYDDFSLGFYGPDGGEALVSCELKSPLTDLDKPQTSGSYRGLTPVQQAMSAVANVSSVGWIIVSNFDEMRLYRNGNSTQYEQVFLTDIHSAFDLRQLLALFSQRTLLGDGSRDSLLEQLYHGRLEMMVPRVDGRIRLVQRVMPHNPDQPELPFYRLEDALRREPHNTLVDHFNGPDVVNDRLVFTHRSSSGEPDWVIEATKTGVLQSSEYIEEQKGESSVTVSGEGLLNGITRFLRQATAFYTRLKLGEVDADWYLGGIAGAICLVRREWGFNFRFLPGVSLKAPQTIQESQMIMSNLTSLATDAAEQKLIPIALRAVRELLYPFSITDSDTGRTMRANPVVEVDDLELTTES